MDIPLAFLLIGIVYALVSYGTTVNFRVASDAGYWDRRQEIVADWLLSLALVVAGSGLVLWVTSVIRSLPLPNAPRLKHHPDAGLLTLLALSFLAFPLLTRFAIGTNIRLGWGSLMVDPPGRASPIELITVVIYCGIASTVANFAVVARLDGIWRALGAAFILLGYGVLFTVITLAIFDLSDKLFHCAGTILLAMIVAQFVLALVNFGWRLRLIVFYPTLLASNIGLISLFYNQVAFREGWDGIFSPVLEKNFLPLVFAIILSMVLGSMQSLIIRRQIRQPWN